MRLKDPFTVVAIVMALLAASVLVLSLLDDERSGTVISNVTSPRGVYLGHLGQGRTVSGSYNADAPLEVYLLSSSEAEGLRDPSYYSDQVLPDPIASGKQGSFRIKVAEAGYYELIFYNGSFTRNHEVSYDINAGKRITELPFMVSIISLSLLTVVLFAISFFRGRRVSEGTSTRLRR